MPGDASFRLFCSARLGLVDVDLHVDEEAMRLRHRFVVRLGPADAKGDPRCARVRPPAVTWSSEPA